MTQAKKPDQYNYQLGLAGAAVSAAFENNCCDFIAF